MAFKDQWNTFDAERFPLDHPTPSTDGTASSEATAATKAVDCQTLDFPATQEASGCEHEWRTDTFFSGFKRRQVKKSCVKCGEVVVSEDEVVPDSNEGFTATFVNPVTGKPEELGTQTYYIHQQTKCLREEHEAAAPDSKRWLEFSFLSKTMGAGEGASLQFQYCKHCRCLYVEK